MSETTTLNAASYTTSGKKRDSVNLPAEVFDGVVNMPVMHQAVKAFLSNQRLGLASTKTRGLVIGGNQKPWKQKGTGRARAGSTRSPVFVGGGTVFGPTPRSYAQAIPKKVRQLARKSALNARAREDALIVVESLNYEKPSTKALVSLFGAIGAVGKKVLLLTDGVKPNVFLSGRNLADAHVMPYSDVSTYHILWSDVVIIEAEALGAHVEGSKRAAREEGDEASEVKAAPKRKGSGKAATKAAAKSAKKKESKEKPSKAAKKTAKKTAKKPAAKKPAAKKKKGK
ncbi:MAG: 50S ribosomal protein L4 [Gemmatimonadota bacterium]|nr:50S ribosomal protein L4 [Gemmatimonadota bacterium]